MKYFFIITLLSFSLQVLAYPEICKGREKEYQDEIARFSETNLKDKTLFAGSSSIRMWKNIHSYFSELYYNSKTDTNYLNRGFGGSQICHLLINYKKIFVGAKKDQQPKRIVIYSGDNDLGNNLTPETVVAHYKELISNLRKEGIDVPIYLLTVKPSPSRLAILDKIKQTGELMETELSKLKNVYVINTYQDFFDQEGKLREDYYLRDGLHLQPVVYRKWAAYLSTFWSVVSKGKL